MSVFSDIGKHLTLSGPSNNTITKTSGGYAYNNAAFGRHIINCGNNDIIQYQIKMNEVYDEIGIGIVSNLHNKNTNKDFDGLHAYWIGVYYGNIYINGTQQDNKGHECREGDILTLVINMKDNRLYSIKNNNTNDIKALAYIKRGLSYRFALTIRKANNSVSVKYVNKEEKEETSNQILLKQIKELENENREKDNKMDEMKAIIASLKDETKRLNSINDKKTIQMNENEKQFEEQKILIESIKKEKIVLEKNNNEKTTQIIVVTEFMNKLKEECKSLNDRIGILEDERKEYEMSINILKEENKKLKLLNINTYKYEQWNVDEIVHWIISLNPQIYGQYEEILLKSLTEEQVNGECMDDIDVSDIKRWGILNFKHSKGLMKHIKLLIENKKNENNQNEMNKQIYNEGGNAFTGYM